MQQASDFSDADDARVYLVRRARGVLARLNSTQRVALHAAFLRVGRELLASAERVAVAPAWATRTWPRRRYPQQCYAKTVKYVLDHPEISGMRLVHGVASHGPRFVPFDHAWVEMPGDVIFDGVVQLFFTRPSYYAVMSAMAVDGYSAAETRRLVSAHKHPGPWNASWVPTATQLATYAESTVGLQDVWTAAGSPVKVGKKR
jgi:hypothetical protein